MRKRRSDVSTLVGVLAGLSGAVLVTAFFTAVANQSLWPQLRPWILGSGAGTVFFVAWLLMLQWFTRREPAEPSPEQVALAGEISRLAERFRRGFKYVRFPGVSVDEMERIDKGENLLEARQQVAYSALSDLMAEADKAKVILPCWQAVGDRMREAQMLWAHDLAQWQQLKAVEGRTVYAFSRPAISPDREQKRLALIEELRGEARYAAVDRVIDALCEALRAYLQPTEKG